MRETISECSDCDGGFEEKTGFCVNHVLYPTRQEIEEKNEKNRLFREIEQRFRYDSQTDISLEQLRAIHGILEGKQED